MNNYLSGFGEEIVGVVIARNRARGKSTSMNVASSEVAAGCSLSARGMADA